jgi:hypothetical protein
LTSQEKLVITWRSQHPVVEWFHLLRINVVHRLWIVFFVAFWSSLNLELFTDKWSIVLLPPLMFVRTTMSIRLRWLSDEFCKQTYVTSQWELMKVADGENMSGVVMIYHWRDLRLSRGEIKWEISNPVCKAWRVANQWQDAVNITKKPIKFTVSCNM